MSFIGAISSLIGRARSAGRYTNIALSSMAHRLLEGMKFKGLADDVGRLKNAGLRKLEAETSAAEAEAFKKNVQAAALANKEIERVLSSKIRKQASAAATSAAWEELADAESRLKQAGGQLFFDPANLRALIQAGKNEQQTSSLGEAAGADLIPVTELELSVRTRKALARLKITNLGQLAAKTPAELLETPNFGHASLAELVDSLKHYKMQLREE